MTDAELLRFGKDNRYMCSPYANLGKPPLEAFMIQLCEARAEWRTEPATTKRCNGSGVTPRPHPHSASQQLFYCFSYTCSVFTSFPSIFTLLDTVTVCPSGEIAVVTVPIFAPSCFKTPVI